MGSEGESKGKSASKKEIKEYELLQDCRQCAAFTECYATKKMKGNNTCLDSKNVQS